MQLLHAKTQFSSALQAWTVSGAVHVVAFGVLALAGNQARRAELSGRAGAVQLEITIARAYRTEPTNGDSVSAQVVVTPANAVISDQHMTRVFASVDTHVLLDSPTDMPRVGIDSLQRAEILPDQPLLEQPLPRAVSQRQLLREPSPNSNVSIPVSAHVPGTRVRIAPSFDNNSPPRYPSAAASAGIQGSVLLRLQIASDGRVIKVEVAQSSGHAILDGAAVNAVKNWRGQPARIGGVPMASTELLPVKFRLR